MRIKFGRPDLASYADRFDAPAARVGCPLSVTFLGVSTLLIDDGESSLLTDGYFSRPGLGTVALGRITPDPQRIDACLARAGIDHVEAVLPVHSHFDHALDSAMVAERTGARLVGGTSTANLGRGHGLDDEQTVIARHGESLSLGPFEVTLIESQHCPPDRYPGTIDEPLRPPARASAYHCGESWSILVRHVATDRRALVQGSAGFVPGSLAGLRAEVAYLAVGQLGLRAEDYLRTYWSETVRTLGARRVVLTHWDDFFRPLDQPLRALPYAGDDLDLTMRMLSGLAREDGVALHLPTVWRPEDPWDGLPSG